MLVDYGIQVAMNYMAAKDNPDMTGKDIWLNDIDWFDVVVSGTVSGLTAGWGTSLAAGEKVSKVGMFAVKHSRLVSLGSSILTSGVDITGNGWQKVKLDDFGKRVAIAGATWTSTELVGRAFNKNSTKVEISNILIEDIDVQFGNNTNQVYHAFRHTDALCTNSCICSQVIYVVLLVQNVLNNKFYLGFKNLH